MVLAFVEHDGGEPDEESLELLTLARSLASMHGTDLTAVAFGDDGDVEALAGELGAYGVDSVRRVAHDDLDAYAPAAWGDAVAQLSQELDAPAVLAPGTDRGQEVMAHVGATLDLPMAANVTDVESADDGDGDYEVTRQRWGGSLVEHARLEGEPKLLTAAAHEVPMEAAAEPTDPSVSAFEPALDDDHLRVRVERVEESDVEGVPLGEARVVIGGGRGVGGPDGYEPLEELADLLGGTVGASRAAVNEGWRPHDDQIGLTGAKISPDVYVACGISGAVQHMVGCKGAKTLLAINTDPEAAIIGKADWAVIGDLHEVVPAINEAIRDAA
jgi:electron transfer flavoprotein alpha subunit